MPDEYGVRLINDKEYAVSNGTQLNYVLRSAGQITNSQFISGAPYSSLLTMNTRHMNAPLLFLKTSSSTQRLAQFPSCNNYLTGMTQDGEAKYRTVWNDITLAKWNSNNIGTIQYYIFDQWVPPERSEYGMQIFDENESIVFDSGWNFLMLKGVKWMNPGYPNHSGSSPAGANYTSIGEFGAGNLAISMPTPRAWIINSGSGSGTVFGWYLYECSYLSGANNECTISMLPVGEYLDQAPSSGWAHPASRSQVMAADVSRLPTTYNPVSVYRPGSNY